jgi:DNA polymerase I-like protein with 3'-5' exonuclease and polymerase domains
VHRYAEQDTVSTLLLFESLDPVLDRENTRDAYRLEVDLLPMVHAMRRRGIRVDISAAEQARDLLLCKRDTVLAQISEKLDANVGMDEINGRKWLISTFDRLGIKYPRTELGNPSFKRGKRDCMQHSPHWLPPLIAAADQLDQYGNNFLQQQILGHIKNGRVYGEIHPHRSDDSGTRSLRFSYSHPPLQQMPKHDEELAPLIRNAFLPEESEKWANCDINQQEFRFVIHFAVRHKLTGAAAARDRYISDPNFDIHAYTSELTGGVISRQDGKTTNFMTIYGAGPEAIAPVIKKSLSETKTLLALYREKLPFIPQLSAACKNAAHRDGHFILFNRARRHFNLWAPGGTWDAGAGPCALEEAQRRARTPEHPWYGRRLWRAEAWKALNALIQSNSAIQTKLWMREVWRAGIVPMLQMHDSLDLSVSSPEQAEMVARLGEEVIKLEVPTVIGVKYGRTWADAKHTWAELHAETGSRIEPVGEMRGDRTRRTREASKFSNDFDEALESAFAGEAVDGTAGKLENGGIDGATESGDVDVVADEALIAAAATNAGSPSQSPPISVQSSPPPSIPVQSPPPMSVQSSPPIPVQAPPPPISSVQSPPPEPPPPPESPQSPPLESGGNGRGDGIDGFASKIDRDGDSDQRAFGDDRQAGNGRWSNYHNAESEKQAGKPYAPVRAALGARGYRVTRTFPFPVPGEAEPRFYEDRYELWPGIAPSKDHPHKTNRFWHRADGEDRCDTGPRRIIFNWPAIMAAGPGSEVDVTEGANKSAALNERGLLATAAPYHQWGPESVSALAGRHLIYHEDHDLPDESGRIRAKELSADARKKLAPVAASFRVVPALHLWKNLGRDGEPPHGWDVKDWLEAGGDPTRLHDICREVPVTGAAILESVCAADEEIEDYEWVWPGRFALKKIGLVVGLPDEGKGLIFSDVMARISRGSPWPCGEGCAPLGSMILLTAEDDINDTIIPRLMAAGADLKRVHIVKMMHEAGEERMFSLVTDLHALRQKVVEVGDVRMVLIDPISAYLGIGKVDSFRATDVRAILGPLKVLAEELRLSILGIMHFNKKIDVTNILLRISDSLAYAAASRHVYGVVDDADNCRKLFVKGKNNIAPKEQKTLAFDFDEREVGIDKRTGKPIRRPFVAWHPDPVDITATEALQAIMSSKSPSERENAVRFLETLLPAGAEPICSIEVFEAAKENGISKRTLERARDGLGIRVKHDGPKNEKGAITWQWHPAPKRDQAP